MKIFLPSEFSITFALFPSIIATHEFVVPKSIPIILYVEKIVILLQKLWNLKWKINIDYKKTLVFTIDAYEIKGIKKLWKWKKICK